MTSGSANTGSNGVRPPQPLMQPWLPLLPHRDAIAQILGEKHLMAILDQPTMHHTGPLPVAAGMADEDSGHRSP